MMKKCLFCDKQIIKKYFESKKFFIEERKYCSKVCKNKANPTKFWLGKKFSEEHKKKIKEKSIFIGETNPKWKGGISLLKYKIICPKCKQERYVGYHQFKNIEKKNSSGKCKKCRESYNFKKGFIPWNKDCKGICFAWNKGICHSLEYKKKLKSAWIKRKEKGLGEAWNKGKKCPEHSGEKHPNWQGGITPINKKIRRSFENKEWRKSVFERDNYTCIECGIKGGKLNADHIKPFSLFPELRFDINNGRTLCQNCHKKIGWSLFKEKNPRKNNILQSVTKT